MSKSIHLRTYSDEAEDDDDSPNVRLTQEHIDACKEGRDTDLQHFYLQEQFDDESYAAIQQSRGNNRGHTSRNWCFTWNNYTSDHLERFKALPGVAYIVWGYELGKQKQTPHLQGFVHFENDRRFGKKNKAGEYHANSLKGMFPECYWKPMYSTVEACIAYCKKDGNFVDWGVPPVGRGNRTDLQTIFEEFLSGEVTTIKEITKRHFSAMVRYGRGIRDSIEYLHEPRSERPKVVWLYGRTGTGKSELAFRRYDPEDIYVKINGSKFWERYDHQPVVLIDEFRPFSSESPDGWDYRYLLQILHRIPITAEVKGASVLFNSDFIYITCQYPPWHFYSGEELEQLLRRIDCVFRATRDSYEKDTVYKHLYFNPDKNRSEEKPMPPELDFLDKQASESLARRRLKLTKSAKIVLDRAVAADGSRSTHSDETTPARVASRQTHIRGYSDEK